MIELILIIAGGSIEHAVPITMFTDGNIFFQCFVMKMKCHSGEGMHSVEL